MFFKKVLNGPATMAAFCGKCANFISKECLNKIIQPSKNLAVIMRFDQPMHWTVARYSATRNEYHILGSMPDGAPSLHYERAKMELNWLGPLLTTSSNTHRISRLVAVVAEHLAHTRGRLYLSMLPGTPQS